jgi:hypothetical protein
VNVFPIFHPKQFVQCLFNPSAHEKIVFGKVVETKNFVHDQKIFQSCVSVKTIFKIFVCRKVFVVDEKILVIGNRNEKICFPSSPNKKMFSNHKNFKQDENELTASQITTTTQ